MTNRTLKELRILPPFAIARMGSSPEPMHNYLVEPDDTEGFRRLVPATTLIVDDDGSISGPVLPERMSFRDGEARVRPVAPFLEVWALFDGSDELEPLTVEDLDAMGVAPDDVQFSIRVANRKLVRRTGDPGDTIHGELTAAELADHSRQTLTGTSDNFQQDGSGQSRRIPLGHVQYIRPNEEFSEIRLRVTPPEGLVYGANPDDIIPDERAVYDGAKGMWTRHDDRSPPPFPQLPLARQTTVPGQIYAMHVNEQNRGFFDDTWDGVVTVTLTTADGTYTARARVSVGPPDFAPDSFPVRSLQDDLEQLVHGPAVEPADVDVDRAIDIVRRAFETMQLMDMTFLNTDRYGSRFRNGALWPRVRARHKLLLDQIQGLRAAEKTPARGQAIAALNVIRTVLRNYDEAFEDFSTSLKMPALMRGSDVGNLAVTRRQKAMIEAAYEKFKDTGPDTQPGEDRLTSFKLHVLPCFRQVDIDAMNNLGPKSIDLTSYEQVKAKSQLILDRLRGIGGSVMPPVANEGPWPNEWIDLFARWRQEGHPE